MNSTGTDTLAPPPLVKPGVGLKNSTNICGETADQSLARGAAYETALNTSAWSGNKELVAGVLINPLSARTDNTMSVINVKVGVN